MQKNVKKKSNKYENQDEAFVGI